MSGPGHPSAAPGVNVNETAKKELAEEAEELEQHAFGSLRRAFGEKRISLRTMDRPLRLGTAILVLCVAATVLALSLRDLGGTGVFLGENNGAVTEISTAAFVLSLVLISIGFGYLFTAVTDAGPVIAFPTIAVLLFLVGLYTGAFGALVGGLDYTEVLPAWTPWVTRGILAATFLLSAAVQLFDRRRKRARSRSIRLEILLAYSLLVGSYFFFIHAGSPTIGRLNLYGPVVGAILAYLSFLLYPILQVTAVDFAEWGEIGGHRLALLARGRRLGPLALGIAATAGMALYGAFQVGTGSPTGGRLLEQAAEGTGFLAVIIAVMSGLVLAFRGRLEAPAPRINFVGLVGVCAIAFVLLPPLALYLDGGIPRLQSSLVKEGRFAPGADVVSLHGSSGPTSFSLQVPRGWIVAESGRLVVARDNGQHGSYQRIEAVVLPFELNLSTMVRDLKLTARGPASQLGPWQRQRVATPGTEGLLWVQPLRANGAVGTYFIYELVHGSFQFDASRPLFEAVVRSFRGGRAPPAPLPRPASSEGQQPSFGSEITIILALLLGLAVLSVLAVGLLWRRAGQQLVLSVLLGLLVALFSLAFYLQTAGRYLFGAHLSLPLLTQPGILFGCGLLGFLVVMHCLVRGRHETSAGRRLITGVVGLEGAVAALQLAQWLYGRALAANRIPVWAGLIVLLGALWELVMSGESLTNRDTRRLPRATRLFAYFGYLVILMGVVLYSSAEKVIATGHLATSNFEPESITKGALFRFGLPVLLLLFLVQQLAGSRKTGSGGLGPAGEPEGPAAEAESRSGSPDYKKGAADLGSSLPSPAT